MYTLLYILKTVKNAQGHLKIENIYSVMHNTLGHVKVSGYTNVILSESLLPNHGSEKAFNHTRQFGKLVPPGNLWRRKGEKFRIS